MANKNIKKNIQNYSKPNEVPEILSIKNISPHNQALYESGKTLLIESVISLREFCKSMIGVCTGSIPVYLGILTFLLPESYRLNFINDLLIIISPVLFLLATIFFLVGYLPVISNFSLNIVEEIEWERKKIISHRSKYIKIGFTFYTIGLFWGIIVIVLNLGVR